MPDKRDKDAPVASFRLYADQGFPETFSPRLNFSLKIYKRY